VVHSHHTWLKFVRNYLDVANRLEEAIAGLIMVLGLTRIAGFAVGSEKQGVHTLLLAPTRGSLRVTAARLAG